MVKLSIDMQEKIVHMFQKGENHCNIARALNIGRTTTRKVCLKFQENGSVFDKKRSGRPKKFTERETRILCRSSTQDPFRTSRQVFIESAFNTTASIRTIQSYLSNSGLPGRIAERKTLISDHSMKKRVS